jgi:hypothetical protein
MFQRSNGLLRTGVAHAGKEPRRLELQRTLFPGSAARQRRRSGATAASVRAGGAFDARPGHWRGVLEPETGQWPRAGESEGRPLP